MASAAGAARNPAWYYNLAAHPDQVWIETAGRKATVTAEQLHGAERDEAWRQITAAAPRFAAYQKATDRELRSSAWSPAPAEQSALCPSSFARHRDALATHQRRRLRPGGTRGGPMGHRPAPEAGLATNAST